MIVEPFSLDLAAPLTTARGRIERRRGILVRCMHRGTSGVGEATPLPGWTESYEDCHRALTDALDHVACGDVSAARRSVPAEAAAARHGISTALVDADARADGISLCEWFDPERSPASVPVNATIGDCSPADVETAALEAIEAGFECLKVKVGGGPLDRDVERLRAVRHTVGDDPTLRVDANGAWSRNTAETALEEFADLGVAYLEQPLAPADLAGHAALRDGPIDIALDESLAHHNVATVLDAGAADVCVLKPMVLGGPGAAYAIGTRCRGSGVEPVVSTTIGSVVARTAAVHVAAAIPDVRPCGLATADRLASDLGPDPAPVHDGRMQVPTGPGLGIDEVSADG
jgi:o-succinylbenzoate synthase